MTGEGSLPPPPEPDAVRYELPGPALADPAVPPAPRRYDLDALRGFAMLLGIALHAAIPFVPYWRDGDAGGEQLYWFFEFVHGFRMPLFFMLSGFFTTMLWRRRGLGSLLRHRLRRIALPLLIGVFTVLPAVIIGIIAGYVISGVDLDAGDAIGQYDEEIQTDPETAGIRAADDDLGEEGADEPFGFAHMWFLWFLLWMVAGFAVVVGFVRWLARKRGRERPTSPRLVSGVLLTLPVLAILPATTMIEPVFGPDTSQEFIPNSSVLSFYACFFAFGALAYDRSTDDAPLMVRIGRGWPVQLAVASLLLFPVGLALIDDHWEASATVQVAFAWLMSFGLIGLFHRYLSEKNFRVRYLSDASYWMYLAHLPLVFVGQGVAARLDLPPVVGFAAITVSVTAILLITYRYIVRYTFIGRLLNGSRSREQDAAQRAKLGSAG